MQVVGYVYKGECYCEDCLPVPQDDEGQGAIFIDSEWDYPVHCCKCDYFIETRLTKEGLEQTEEAILTFEESNRKFDWIIEWRQLVRNNQDAAYC